ncbi:MAG: hypothetical protein Q4C49_00780 [Bacillota bacterium]|nr:hypothetical protein [Bacillota bacterium]
MESKKQKNTSSKQKTISATKIKQRSIGKRNRERGHAYERKIVNELKEITGDEDLCTSRSESKKLDDMKIDIADPNNTLSFYCQIKSTQQTPQIKKLNDEVGKKDKPLVIFWNAQEVRDKKQISVGEYVILPKDFFYTLLK